MTWEVRTTGSDTACSGGFRGGASIAAPSAPTVTGAGTGGTVAAGTYYVVVTYTDGLGETVISGEASVTVSGATSKFTVTSPAAATGALTWSAYSATAAGGPYFPISAGLTIGSDLVRTTTPPTSGTQPRGVDRTLQNGAQLTVDNSAVTCTTTGANSNTLTFTGGYTPTGADVGNTFRATGGTNVNAGTYEITAVTSTTWTVTGATNLTTAGGAGSAVLGVMGGGLASVGQASTATVVGNTIYKKSPGTYTIGNGTVNTAGNKFGMGTNLSLIGYSTNRNPENTDTAPVLDAGAASMTMVSTLNGTGIVLHNLSFTNSSLFGSVTALNSGGTNPTFALRRLAFANLANPFSNTATGAFGTARDCSFSGCGTMTGGIMSLHRCTFSASTGQAMPSAFIGTNGGLYDCAFVNCAGSGSSGVVALTGTNQTIRNCVFYNTTASGATALVVGGTDNRVENTIVYGTTGNGPGIGASGLVATTALLGVAVGGTGTGAGFSTSLASYQKVGCVTLAADPFANAAGLDFSLNTAAGGGALCRAAGWPGSTAATQLVGLSTPSYPDVGVSQHADPAASGLFANSMNGGFL